MSKLLSEWPPSAATLELLKLNGLDEAHIERSLVYLKTQTELEDMTGPDVTMDQRRDGVQYLGQNALLIFSVYCV